MCFVYFILINVQETIIVAGSSLLALIDDITSILDDVALMTKVATKKTAGVLGDDLALNAQQVSGVRADREIPVVLAVGKGSLINKAILVPLALTISAFIPWLINILLMLGGAFLCYEGVEKLVHTFIHKKETKSEEHLSSPLIDNRDNLAILEKNKIKGAIRTDFILSAEIIVITLGTLTAATFMEQVTVLTIIAIAMTIGVYGLVAGIVKLDDLGLFLSQKESKFARSTGNLLIRSAPYLMRTLSIVGTAAMFMVGGGILTHGLSTIHHIIEDVTLAAQTIPTFGILLGGITPILLNVVVGIIVGAAVLALVSLVNKIKEKLSNKVE